MVPPELIFPYFWKYEGISSMIPPDLIPTDFQKYLGMCSTIPSELIPPSPIFLDTWGDKFPWFRQTHFPIFPEI